MAATRNAEVTRMERVRPGDLNACQAERIARAIGLFEARCAALDAGMSLDEVQAQRFAVDVQPL